MCYESLSNKDFPRANITAKCEHSNSVCTACIGARIDAKVDIVRLHDLSDVPRDACVGRRPTALWSGDIRKVIAILSSFSIPLTLSDRYDRLATRTALQKDSTFHFCLESDCGSCQYNDDEECHKVICAVCEFATCTHHDMAWHEGQTCEEYDSDMDEVLAEARRQMTSQERKEAKGKRRLGPSEIYRQVTRLRREAARQEAARQDAARQDAMARREENR